MTDPPLLSVVLPVFDEVAVLEELHALVCAAVAEAGCRPDIVYVDDGSCDGSAELLDRLAVGGPGTTVLHLARNFGHQAAVQAGLQRARGHAVVVMDSDLQDATSAIPRFVDRWRAGAEVVYAVRVERKEGPLKRALFFAFYRVLGWLSSTRLPLDAGNFCLLDRAAAQAVAGLCERDRYFAGLRGWVGFRQVGIEVERGPRYDGRARVSLLGLFRLAKSAIFSFSTVPLALFYAIAGLALATFVALGGFALYHRLFTGLAIPGWTSTLLTASFFGGLNSLGIGILGEFIARIYDQVRARPLFIVARTAGGADSAGASSSAYDREAPR
jgi:dolichol-phosphate mannosyltransferase